MHIKTIDMPDGDEINVYRSKHGYHAEYWDQTKQLVTQSGPYCKTLDDACDAIDPSWRLTESERE